LRFTLSVPGVHVAIVGTTKPTRWKQNLEIVNKGTLGQKEFDAIRARWAQVAKAEWVGQI
jgi:aryl-alcohol dehydrogenase-like predicted oxidoreductase